MIRIPKLLLVRHGATNWTAEQRYNSETETEISSIGRAQLQRTSELLAKFEIKRIISSPRIRARQSAEIFASSFGIDPNLDDRLRELSFGPFEGRTRDDLARPPFAESFKLWRNAEGHITPNGVESLDAVADRAREFFDEVIRKEGITLVVSHGVFLRVLLCASVLGMNPQAFFRLKIDSGSYSEVSFDGEHYSLSALNCASSTAE